jgi:predicted phage-related endonuclease
MTMQIHDVKQGSPEWHALRAQHYCASDAPAMLGLSKYKTRNDLLREKATGYTPEVDAGTQMLFDRGHEAEAMIRPAVEVMIGEDLFPAVGTEVVDGLPLLSSFDGITMAEDVQFEHKLYAQWLAEYLREHGDLHDTHWPQVEQQMLICGAERTLFVTSDGTTANFESVWYESKPERRAQVIAGWKQFEQDKAAYVPQPEVVKAVAAPIEALPALVVQVQGSLAVFDNMKDFGEQLQAFIARIPEKLETDQHFADAEAAVKALTKAEDALDHAKATAIEQIASVAELQRSIDTYHQLARTTRLKLEKLVKAEKDNRKAAIVTAGAKSFADHVTALEREFSGVRMPVIPTDFNGAIKGLKSITSIQNAVDTEVARAKMAATEAATRIRRNLAYLGDFAELSFLFADRAQIVLKEPDDLQALVKLRVAEHQAAEQKRIDAERERIRAEEQARADREAREKLAAEQRAQQQNTPPVESGNTVAAPVRGPAIASAPAVATSSVESSATMTLGQIATRMGFALPAAFLQSLGIPSVGRDRSAVLYREADFPRICDALTAHIATVRANATPRALAAA